MVHSLAGYIRCLVSAKILSIDETLKIIKKSINLAGVDILDSDVDIVNYANLIISNKFDKFESNDIRYWANLIDPSVNELTDGNYKMLDILTDVLHSKNIDGFSYINKFEGSKTSLSWIVISTNQIAPLDRFISL